MAGTLRKDFFLYLLTFFFFKMPQVNAQTIGGNSTFTFIKLPNTPQLTALGGINISNKNNDASLAFNNPALLRDTMNGQFSAVFNSFFAGIKNYHAMFTHFSKRLNLNVAGGVNFFDYGITTQTDASGIITGSFRPVDYLVQVSAAQGFSEQWHYGVTIKYINSSYAQYRSIGIAADFGVTYFDEKNLLQIGFAARNMGSQLKAYGTLKEDLPFDVELGISKRMQKIPLQFSITAHHLHQFDSRFGDAVFENDFNNDNLKKHTIDKIFRHIIFAVQMFPTDKIEFSLGYNYLRRSELHLQSTTNGLNGFSIGLGAIFSKIQVRYARAYYQNTSAYNQFGLNIKLHEYFNFGK
jgi:hypothetical protein